MGALKWKVRQRLHGFHVKQEGPSAFLNGFSGLETALADFSWQNHHEVKI